MAGYEQEYRRSLDDPEGFWGEVARDVHWTRPWDEVGFVVCKAGVEKPEEQVVRELIERVRDRIGPVAFFKTASVVKRLPKTRSGKILRGTMRRMADGQEVRVPPTIDDPAILDEIRGVLGKLGYPKKV